MLESSLFDIFGQGSSRCNCKHVLYYIYKSRYREEVAFSPNPAVIKHKPLWIYGYKTLCSIDA